MVIFGTSPTPPSTPGTGPAAVATGPGLLAAGVGDVEVEAPAPEEPPQPLSRAAHSPTATSGRARRYDVGRDTGGLISFGGPQTLTRERSLARAARAHM